jgi:hypothetical protein
MERKFAHTRPLSSQNHSSKPRSRKNSMGVGSTIPIFYHPIVAMGRTLLGS